MSTAKEPVVPRCSQVKPGIRHRFALYAMAGRGRNGASTLGSVAQPIGLHGVIGGSSSGTPLTQIVMPVSIEL
jgi:hypothetical protein